MYGDFGGDAGHFGGDVGGFSFGSQGRLGESGGVAIAAHRLPHGETGGGGLHGFLGGGEAGGEGPLMLLLSSPFLSAGSLLIPPFICIGPQKRQAYVDTKICYIIMMLLSRKVEENMNSKPKLQRLNS